MNQGQLPLALNKIMTLRMALEAHMAQKAVLVILRSQTENILETCLPRGSLSSSRLDQLKQLEILTRT